MSQNDTLNDLYEKLKSSPHWREDFKIEEEKNVAGIPVYYIKADDQEPATNLAIAKLNEVLQKR